MKYLLMALLFTFSGCSAGLLESTAIPAPVAGSLASRWHSCQHSRRRRAAGRPDDEEVTDASS